MERFAAKRPQLSTHMAGHALASPYPCILELPEHRPQSHHQPPATATLFTCPSAPLDATETQPNRTEPKPKLKGKIIIAIFHAVCLRPCSSFVRSCSCECLCSCLCVCVSRLINFAHIRCWSGLFIFLAFKRFPLMVGPAAVLSVEGVRRVEGRQPASKPSLISETNTQILHNFHLLGIIRLGSVCALSPNGNGSGKWHWYLFSMSELAPESP